jgi:hypothetical protein
MSAGNRSAALLSDVLSRLKEASAVTDHLPDGAENIHPRPQKGAREESVSLNVGFAGGSGERRGPSTRSTRLVIVQLEADPEYFEGQPTRWPYEVLDAVEATLEGVGGGGRAPDGRGAGLAPAYDPEKDRYVADTTFRYVTSN